MADTKVLDFGTVTQGTGKEGKEILNTSSTDIS